MNFKGIICFSLICFFHLYLFAQAPQESAQKRSNEPFERYERSSVTNIFLNMPSDRYNNDLQKVFIRMPVNDKFNSHNLTDLPFIDAPYDRGYNPSLNYAQLVLEKLNQVQAGNKVIAKWFNQNKDGKFDMSVIAERGVYNATDADVVRANAGKRGTSALQDAGESLLRKSFVVVYDFIFLETWDEYYDQQDARQAAVAKAQNVKATKVSRTYSGYRGKVKTYVYKVDWNDSLSTVFYEQAWKNPAVLNKMNIPLKYVDQVYLDDVVGSQFRYEVQLADQEKLVKLLADAERKTAVQLSLDNEVFRVKTPLFDTRPPRAKIGLKEDVKIDQRFFVYQMQQNSKGEKVAKRKGVVRATKKITDNRTNATGDTEPTVFYQDAGGRLFPGMLMEQRYDNGIGFSIGWAQRIQMGPVARLEYNLAPLLNISQFKIFLQGQYGFSTVRFGESSTSYNVNSYALEGGFSKEWAMTSNLHLEPFVAVTWDSTWTNGLTTTDKAGLETAKIKNGIRNWGAILGLRIPININYWLQIVPSGSISTAYFNSDNTLYGSTLPKDLPNGILGDKDLLSGGNTQSGTDNSNAHLVKTPFKWEVSMRFKF